MGLSDSGGEIAQTQAIAIDWGEARDWLDPAQYNRFLYGLD
jgi:hypothetical protein